MPKPSSNSARVTFLDVPATVERIRRAAQGLCAANPHVTAVVLFGSLADASATPSSDADLLVVLREDSRRVIDRVPDYSRAFEDLGLAAQVFPWTIAELDERLAQRDPFAREIMGTGTVLAGALARSTAVG